LMMFLLCCCFHMCIHGRGLVCYRKNERCPKITDQTRKTTEQTKINISFFLVAMIGSIDSNETGDNINAGDSGNRSCEAV